MNGWPVLTSGMLVSQMGVSAAHSGYACYMLIASLNAAWLCLALLCALAIDLWWGEPPAPLHPVVWMGRALGACGARLAPARATGRDLWSFWLAALIWCALAAIVLFLAAALQWLEIGRAHV